MEKVYLGDGVYIEDWEGYGVKLFASDGISETDTIVLEINELRNLIEVLKKSKYKDLLF